MQPKSEDFSLRLERQERTRAPAVPALKARSEGSRWRSEAPPPDHIRRICCAAPVKGRKKMVRDCVQVCGFA